MNPKGVDTTNGVTLQERIFGLKCDIVYSLQPSQFQTDQLIDLRKTLVEDIHSKILELDRGNYEVKMDLRYIDKFSNPDSLKALSKIDLTDLKEHVAPHILPYEDQIDALRFDSLIYYIEALKLLQKSYSAFESDLKKKSRLLLRIASRPEIREKMDLLQRIVNTDLVKQADMLLMERIRCELRDLIQYLDKSDKKYETDIDDSIIQQEVSDSIKDDGGLADYRTRAEQYLHNNADNPVIIKLHMNEPLNQEDIEELQRIFWQEVGTLDEYKAAYNLKPLQTLVREVVKLDRTAANQAFDKYLEGIDVTDRQRVFIKAIVDHLVENGIIDDLSVLLQQPFRNIGSVNDVFGNDVWPRIRLAIDEINENGGKIIN